MRRFILKGLNEAERLPDRHKNNYNNYVWFYPKEGKFLYSDVFVTNTVVCKLIEDGTLKYDNIFTHQGEKMARYSKVKKLNKVDKRFVK